MPRAVQIRLVKITSRKKSRRSESSDSESAVFSEDSSEDERRGRRHARRSKHKGLGFRISASFFAWAQAAQGAGKTVQIAEASTIIPSSQSKT